MPIQINSIYSTIFGILSVYINHHYSFSLRLTLENCKVCKESDCTGDSLEIIQNACSDTTQLSNFVSTPLSTNTTTNELINSINSEFSYQLAEMTLFKFPNSEKCNYSNYRVKYILYVTYIIIHVLFQ